PARVRRRRVVGRQFSRPADRPRPGRDRDRAGDARRTRRATDRPPRQPRPLVRTAGFPRPRSGDRIRVHDAADCRGSARGGVPGARDPGQRPIRSHGGQPGGHRADGHDGGLEGRSDSRECRADRGSGAPRGGSGPGIPEATRARARGRADLRGGARRRARPGRRPTVHRRHRARRGGDPGGAIRSGGRMTAPRTVRAPRGPQRSCKGWVQEAALRMLMNNLDPDVAERPQDLVVYGGTGKAARDWPAFHAICRTLLTLGDGVCLAVEVDPARVHRRIETRYLDRATASLDEALRWCEEAKRTGRALSVGLIGNCADVLPELARRGFVPDVLTDQTSAHDSLNGYIPLGLTV